MNNYDRKKVYEYAKKWAYSRNPKYYNFDPVGGDCTNFVSQCILAGYGQMNYEKDNGWYYINGNDKSPSWTGVEYLYNFLINNRGIGPQGKEINISEIEIGDVVQLGFDGKQFSHSCIVVKNGDNNYNTLVAAHTHDVFGKSVADYLSEQQRFIHIE